MVADMSDEPSSIAASDSAAGSGKRHATFPIVGLGASAGGLEALQQILRAVPAQIGMGFVVVQHLSPERESGLAGILSRATEMPVCEVRDEPMVQPDHVYIIPPGRDMVITEGKLRLLPQERGARHRGIDQFFRSLAEDLGHLSIGVVLSGSASDGSLGIEEIKAAGGITFAQDESAQHDSMPHSAVATGCVDFVLPPAEIVRELARIARHPHVAGEEEDVVPRPEHARIAQIVRRATGVDFTNYKANTLHRRITRRMMLHKIESLGDYEDLLRRTPGEVEALYRDILISVTSFFRNPDAFDALATKVFPAILARHSSRDPVRIWSLGCSTGEEAYSLAIVFAECAEKVGSALQFQLFATDLNGEAIDKARVGLYSQRIAQDVSPERLRRFFVEEKGGYRISKAIRERCVFSRHNVLADPPFSRVDLVACRNLLIYLEPELQQQILPLLHYALKPGGYLWLGSSESVGASRNLFDVEDARNKFFCRRAGPPTLHRTGAETRMTTGPFPREPQGQRETPHASLHRDAERILLAKYAPPSVVISAAMEIVQFRGETGAYLAPAAGMASLNLFKMLRESLLAGVRSAIVRAGELGRAVREEGLRMKSDGGFREVAVEVIPVKAGPGKEGGFVVLFDEGVSATQPSHEVVSNQHTAVNRDDEVSRLTQELAATREYLQSVIEQQEAANEELQSSNEEAQSANEELQSVNEELETSKEEIQSTSEELATVNDELHNRNTELNQLTNDLTNVLVSVRMPILIVGRDLRIRRFTPAAEKALNLVVGDIGRPLADVRLSLAVPGLERLLREVIDSVGTRECEVKDTQGRWYSLRARPYQTHDNKIDGAVVALVDIDDLHRARDFAEDIVASVRVPLVMLDAGLRVKSASLAFYDSFKVEPSATIGRLIYDLGNRQWNIPALRKLLEEVLPENSEIVDFEMRHNFEEIGLRTMLLNARRLEQATGNEPLIVLSIEDVTERRRLEDALVARAQDLTQADRNKDEFLAMLAHELRNPLAPLRNATEILRTPNASSEEREDAETILTRQIESMSRLIDDLLDVARITEGKIELRKQPVALEAILTSAANTAGSTGAAEGQELTVSLPAEPVWLNADAARLEQVFGNILGNACKYGGEGCHIRVSAERTVNAESHSVVVRVRDDGIGIDPAVLPHVFELFVQSSRTLDRSYGGLGIGLTLVRRLVELHGGQVEARSEGPGKGGHGLDRP